MNVMAVCPLFPTPQAGRSDDSLERPSKTARLEGIKSEGGERRADDDDEHEGVITCNPCGILVASV
jgi:hypothetical protein